jgi:hypothetical protein
VNVASEGMLTRIWRVFALGVWAHIPPLVMLALLFLASLIFLDSDDPKIAFRAANTIKGLVGFLPILMLIGGTICVVWILVTQSRFHTVMNTLRWL